jgi:aspartate aminotransferase
MNFLSDRINKMEESATLAMTRMSRDLECKGFNVINLSIGEPDFNTPEFIKDAAKRAIDQNYTHYPPVPGYQDLKEAICVKLKRDNNLDYKPAQVVVSTGAKQALANAILSLVNPGDEVIIPAPFWVSYSELIKLAEGIPVYVSATIENDFKITAAQLEAAITPKTKLFMFNSPNNPTGSVYGKVELESLAKVLEKHENVFIIADEIYEHINFVGKHESLAQFEPIKDRIVLINGVSKGYAMTGWRLGYLAARTEIATACNKMQGQITSGACSIAQRAAIDAMLMKPENAVEMLEMVAAFKNRRDLLLQLLNDIPGIKTNIPDGAFYVFPDVTYYYGKTDGECTVNNGDDLCMYLLKNACVALVPGSAFGDPACIRFSYATSEEKLIEAAKRVKAALAELK